jgi:arabinofuranosyltransferase
VEPPPKSQGAAEWRRLAPALAAALAAYAWLALRFDFVCDDAYISFRYARNLASGLGLRFNPAEVPPVEGYSNLLWVLGLAPFEALRLDVALAARATSLVCGALLIALALRLAARRLELGRPAALATGLALATLPPFAVWATGGLGTMAFALALFATFERLALEPARPRTTAAAFAAIAAVLLRMDGALWVAWVLAAAWLGAPREARRAAFRAAGIAGGAAALAVIGQVAFRVSYHHEWVPNLARVKVGLTQMRLERGFKYVATQWLELPALALVPLVAIAWPRARSRATAQAFALVACASAYAVFVGGDFMAMGRFLVPALPFFALAFAGLARALERRLDGLAGLTTAVVLSSLLCAFDRAPVPRGWRAALHFRWNEQQPKSETQQWCAMRDRAREWAEVGRALALHTRPGQSIVLPNLGAMTYPTALHAYDLFGLVSPEVARRTTPPRRASPGHDKGVDVGFFLDRKPDYLGAWIAPAASAPESGLPETFLASPLYRQCRIERFPLERAGRDGAPSELRLLRLVWS